MESLATYYTSLPAARARKIQQIVERIETIYPDVKASLKYKMPTFEHAQGWLAVGNQKHHIALYTCKREHIEPYIQAHPMTDHGKGCLRFNDSSQVDLATLDIVITQALSL